MGVAYSGDLLSKKHVHAGMDLEPVVRAVLVRTYQALEIVCHQVKLHFEAVKCQEGHGFCDHQ